VRPARPHTQRAPELDDPTLHACESKSARRVLGDATAVVGYTEVHLLRIDPRGDLDASGLGMADHVRYGLLTDAQQGPFPCLYLRHVAIEIQM